ncbi:unnamed protein product, partial [Polarella glacialis]
MRDSSSQFSSYSLSEEATWEPPDRPTSAPPVFHPEGLTLRPLRSSSEVARLAAYGAHFELPLDLPDRPRSAPIFEQEDGRLGGESEDEVRSLVGRAPVLDPKGKNLFAFQASRLPPPRPTSGGASAQVAGQSEAHEQRAQNIFGLQAARLAHTQAAQASSSPAAEGSALGTLSEDDRFTPPPQ